mgnify:CR=1 FL=1
MALGCCKLQNKATWLQNKATWLPARRFLVASCQQQLNALFPTCRLSSSNLDACSNLSAYPAPAQ